MPDGAQEASMDHAHTNAVPSRNPKPIGLPVRVFTQPNIGPPRPDRSYGTRSRIAGDECRLGGGQVQLTGDFTLRDDAVLDAHSFHVHWRLNGKAG
jgi:hypothetical protein